MAQHGPTSLGFISPVNSRPQAFQATLTAEVFTEKAFSREESQNRSLLSWPPPSPSPLFWAWNWLPKVPRQSLPKDWEPTCWAGRGPRPWSVLPAQEWRATQRCSPASSGSWQGQGLLEKKARQAFPLGQGGP